MTIHKFLQVIICIVKVFVGNIEQYLYPQYFETTIFSGVVDSSGMEFFYSNTPPRHRAGLMSVGHSVRNIMIIPPNAENYTITSACPGSCTQTVS